ncbi:MAG: filamentous hemagglutinin N-terminal domain-containing protein, partial [Proteobacteria bacterium]|nr:filamentous hemagglutinin N-terminal domain-containing protein [Pseudomonadota bacterium]
MFSRSLGGALLLSAASLALASGAWANPQGGTVRAGGATISSAPGRTEINQSSDRAIIDWRGFSIGAGEVTRFNQPSSTSAALNRVTGADPSQILGQLSANGRVLLINPNGVLFGAGSRVDVAGLVATTANISNEDFMARRLSFATPGQPGASVVNRGTITVAEGGLVALVAPGVANEGVINARLGRVSLVSANRFTVDFHGDRLIQFALDDKVMQQAIAPDGAPLGAAVTNSGRIAADGGIVQMSANVARGVVDRTIDMSGKIEARAVRQVGGRIVLDGGETGIVQVAGTLDVSGRAAGQTGGRVEILGRRVGLFSGATVDAAGDAGGGTVLVGGSALGQGPQRNAEATYVDKQASIKADAVTKGDGGTVVVWSDSYTRFDGTISARGGAQGGNGGQVETSSHDLLAVGSGRVDAAAPAGKPGLWLLDPSNATISHGAAGADVSMTTSGGPPVDVFTANANNAVVTDGSINAALNAGENVSITNGAGGNGIIKFDNNGVVISENSAVNVSLTLNANGNITVQNAGTAPTIAATGTGTLSLVFTAGGSVEIPQSSLNGGSVTVNGAGNITQTGAITAGAASLDAGAGAITLTTAANAFSGAVSLNNSGANNVQLTNNAATVLGTSTVGQNLTVTSGGSITQTGVLTVPGTTTLASTVASSDILLSTQANNFTGAVSVGGTLANIRDFALRNANAGATAPTLNTLTGLRNLTLQFDNAAIALGAFSASGTATISARGAITQTGAASVTGTSSFTAGAHAITLTQAANSFTGAVSLSNSGANNVALVNNVATVLASATIGQNLTVTSNGAITQTAAATVGGTSSFAAGANAITLTQAANSFTGAVTLSNSGANAASLTTGGAL